MNKLFVVLLLSLPLPFAAGAKEAVPVGKDPAIEHRMNVLAQELRCLVCQNQTIADSHAGLADDLRQEIRELMERGKTDQEIKDYLVARYGEFVLYRPPLQTSTALLWFGPAALMVAGLAGLYITLIRRRKRAEAAPLSQEDEQRAQHLLADDIEEGKLS